MSARTNFGACRVPPCERAAKNVGYCHSHYEAKRRTGVEPTERFPETVEERFFAKVEKQADGCWLWVGAKGGPDRYGLFWYEGRKQQAHRVAYKLLVGPLSDDLDLDHLCRVTLCVNPAHGEPVTHLENVLRGTAPTALNARKTHCPWGHALPAYEPGGRRPCDECTQIVNARRRATRRGRDHGLTRSAALLAHFAEQEVAA